MKKGEKMAKERLGIDIMTEVVLRESLPKIDLSEVGIGDKIFFKVGKCLMEFEITRPAKKGCRNAEDSARGFLRYKGADGKRKEVRILMGGACNYCPDSELGFAHLSLAVLMKEKSYVYWWDMPDFPKNLVSVGLNPISQMMILRAR